MHGTGINNFNFYELFPNALPQTTTKHKKYKYKNKRRKQK